MTMNKVEGKSSIDNGFDGQPTPTETMADLIFQAAIQALKQQTRNAKDTATEVAEKLHLKKKTSVSQT